MYMQIALSKSALARLTRVGTQRIRPRGPPEQGLMNPDAAANPLLTGALLTTYQNLIGNTK